MLTLVLRKMISNKWLVVCILTGLLISTSVISCIPVYTDAILERMLIKDLEAWQSENDQYAGMYVAKQDYMYNNSPDQTYRASHDVVYGDLLPTFGLTVENMFEMADSSISFQMPDPDIVDKVRTKYANFGYFTGFAEHVTITNGRMFSSVLTDNTYEVVATKAFMEKNKLIMDKPYRLNPRMKSDTSGEDFYFRIVGVFDMKAKQDTYWVNGITEYTGMVVMDQALYDGSLLGSRFAKRNSARWNLTFDYHQITLDNLDAVDANLTRHVAWLKTNKFSFKMPAYDIIREYAVKEKQLKTTLMVLQMPVFLMLFFYIFMVSRQKIDYEGNEIAVLKSRGSSTWQIFRMYVVESFILGTIAFVAGPFLGLLLGKFIGSSNGFMDFVARVALPVKIDAKSFAYAGVSVLVFSLSMLIPAFLASRESIVVYKQKKSGSGKRAFWKKAFLDVILLGVAAYGFTQYKRQLSTISLSGIQGSEIGVDPLLFVISTIFIFGAGLLCIRFFPFLTGLIFRLGKRHWSPVLYASLTQVSRSAGYEQFVMLFLILTLSIGIFNGNTARTLNRNVEDKVRYDVGADLVAKGVWEDNQDSGAGSSMAAMMGAETTELAEEMYWYEPPYELYEKLTTIRETTKVFRQDEGVLQTTIDGRIPDVTVLGIEPYLFGQVAWFREDLLDHHINEYLNLMTDSPTAILVSASLAEKYTLKPGDAVHFGWDSNWFNGTVYAVVDYWPSINPMKAEGDKKDPQFIVANLQYIHTLSAVEPYSIWMEKVDGATSADVYAEIEASGIELESLADTGQTIVGKKNDPMLQGINGTLTLDFIIVVAVSIIGFLIFWILSIKKRVLQFGVFRAMGLSFGKIIGMLVCEQLLITGTAIAAGIGIGNMTGRIFVPLLQVLYSAEQQVPPFAVISAAEDYIRLYAVMGLMLVSAFAVLVRIIRNINISQALKLGED